MRRLVWAAATVILTAFFAYGIMRVLRPDRSPPGASVIAGTWADVRDALFVLIVAVSLLADLAIARVDPRIRSGGRPMG